MRGACYTRVHIHIQISVRAPRGDRVIASRGYNPMGRSYFDVNVIYDWNIGGVPFSLQSRADPRAASTGRSDRPFGYESNVLKLTGTVNLYIELQQIY